MKCKINNAVQLIRSQGEQRLREEEGKNARQHGKKWNEVYNKYKPIPKKTQINSSIKYARKLLVESYIK